MLFGDRKPAEWVKQEERPSPWQAWGRRWGVLGMALLLAACTSVPPTPPSGTALPGAERKELRLGLALGGGAARGFAHVGVIQVLEEAGLKPGYVVGTSAGSLVAALYASGKTPAELVRVAETMQEADITTGCCRS